jgi:hypothetical protein
MTMAAEYTAETSIPVKKAITGKGNMVYKEVIAPPLHQ